MATQASNSPQKTTETSSHIHPINTLTTKLQFCPKKVVTVYIIGHRQSTFQTQTK